MACKVNLECITSRVFTILLAFFFASLHLQKKTQMAFLISVSPECKLLWQWEPESMWLTSARWGDQCWRLCLVLKDLLWISLKSVLQRSLSSRHILLPYDGEHQEPPNSDSDWRNVYSREPSKSSGLKNTSRIQTLCTCTCYSIPNCWAIRSSAFQTFTFLLGR